MKVQRRTRAGLAVLGVAVVAAVVAGIAQGTPDTGWGPAVNLSDLPGTSSDLNTSHLEGCPIESPNGKSLYFASDRSGNLDIWVSHRASTSAPWGAPVPLPAPVNSNTANDFCPTPVPGNGLFFVSTRSGYCGSSVNSDIYFTRYNPGRGSWSEPVHLPCATDGGPNSDGWTMGPSYFDAGGHGSLYFSSGPDTGHGHIYASQQRPDGSFGPGTPVAELNSDAADLRPNVSKDGREVVFDSTRSGGSGQFDVYTATRASVDEPWSAPVNAGPNVNSVGNEHRASLSRDGKRLYFGSDRSGDSDIYVSTGT